MTIYGFTVDQLIEKGRVNGNDIAILRKWLNTQKLPKFDDETLALFYMACDKNIENTKKCAQSYYISKRDGPELFDDRDVTRMDIQHQLKILNFCVLPERTDEGYVIILHRLVDTDYSQYHMDVAMKVLFMTINVALYNDPPTGLITLFDMRGVGLRHLTRINLGAVKKFFYYLQEALPLKLVSIHILNVVWFFDKIFKLIKPFINPEVIEKLHLHPSKMNMTSFHENYLPKKCLPQDYEGDLSSVYELQKDTERKFAELLQYYKEEQALCKLSN